VQQSSQSQFLTPGAPSTSTAAPASASGWVPGFIFFKVDSHVFCGL
jgi:hypothetical protein